MKNIKILIILAIFVTSFISCVGQKNAFDPFIGCWQGSFEDYNFIIYINSDSIKISENSIESNYKIKKDKNNYFFNYDNNGRILIDIFNNQLIRLRYEDKNLKISEEVPLLVEVNYKKCK